MAYVWEDIDSEVEESEPDDGEDDFEPEFPTKVVYQTYFAGDGEGCDFTVTKWDGGPITGCHMARISLREGDGLATPLEIPADRMTALAIAWIKNEGLRVAKARTRKAKTQQQPA